VFTRNHVYHREDRVLETMDHALKTLTDRMIQNGVTRGIGELMHQLYKDTLRDLVRRHLNEI
jgi:hypothetical protein